jgi:endonuclease-8
MPEGPSIVILKEETRQFIGQKIMAVGGNSKIGIERLLDKTVKDIKSWGKHYLIEFDDFTLKIHFLLFGSYRVDGIKENRQPRLALTFSNGEINFYSCSVKYIDKPLNEIYDWTADVMNPTWNPAKAKKKLLAKPNMLACDALLDQDIFAGVGNIIKNEVLFRIKVHPLSLIGKLPPARLNALIKEAHTYSFEFYEWKKKYELKKHWLVHNKKICPRDEVPLIKKWLGKTDRRSFYCEICQKLYA